MHMIQSINLSDARRMIDAAVAKAQEIASPSNIAVVDAGGNLVSHVRMDGSWIGGVRISIDKAWTARAFDMTTKELGDLSEPGKPFHGIQHSGDGRVALLAGGVPVKQGSIVVGAVGVSGGIGKHDHLIAEAAAAVFSGMR